MHGLLFGRGRRVVAEAVEEGRGEGQELGSRMPEGRLQLVFRLEGVKLIFVGEIARRSEERRPLGGIAGVQDAPHGVWVVVGCMYAGWVGGGGV